MTLSVQGREATLKHFANAHTDGDTYVYFAGASVLSAGDIVTLGTRYPNIDFANGGTIDGMITATDVYLSLANDGTKIVPGHGATDQQGRGHGLPRDAHDGAGPRREADADGKSLDDAVAAKPFADIGARIDANEEQNANFVRVIYHSLKP